MCATSASTTGGNSKDAKGAIKWCWDCVLCDEEFTESHFNKSNHLKQAGYLDCDSHRCPDPAVFLTAEATFQP